MGDPGGLLRCSTCGEGAEGFRQVNAEAAAIHDLVTGDGIFIAPGLGHVLPACADHGGSDPGGG